MSDTITRDSRPEISLKDSSQEFFEKCWTWLALSLARCKPGVNDTWTNLKELDCGFFCNKSCGYSFDSAMVLCIYSSRSKIRTSKIRKVASELVVQMTTHPAFSSTWVYLSAFLSHLSGNLSMKSSVRASTRKEYDRRSLLLKTT